ELKADSGGAGRFRGGLALETELMVEVDCNVTAFASRVVDPPKGIFGGEPGMPAVVAVRGRDGTKRQLPQKFVDQPTAPGGNVGPRACGGGGYGDPRERSDHAIQADLAAGFVSGTGLAAYGR